MLGSGNEKVVEVAAELAGRVEVPGDVDASELLRQVLRQQRHLHALGEAHFLFEPDLVVAQRFVEARVLDGDRRLRRQQRQQLDVLLRKRVELRALEIEDADAAIFEQQWNRQLGSNVVHRRGRTVESFDTSGTSTGSFWSAA